MSSSQYTLILPTSSAPDPLDMEQKEDFELRCGTDMGSNPHPQPLVHMSMSNLSATLPAL